MIFDRHANLKYRYGNRKFWCTGFYVDTVGRNKKVIEEYIRNQIQDDVVAEQISMMEYIDPLIDKEVKKNRGGNQEVFEIGPVEVVPGEPFRSNSVQPTTVTKFR
ncbi:hypothetical protein ABID52_000621 [Fictibacillus halophilus]|uniref:Transposase IS200-like domain-containing protein n=1 Tax=Fictibacillus halophilus TaxID=1610490 RepID=A0ABV2LEM2_9BACL